MLSLKRFWQSDRGLSVLLVFLFLTLIIAPPLLRSGALHPLFFDVLLSLILISGAVTVSGRRWPAIVATGLATVTLTARWAVVSGLTWSFLPVADAVLSFASLATLAGLVLFQVLRQGAITIHRVLGAVAAYLLLGFAWSSAYELVLEMNREAFRFPDANADQLSLLYYSFVTLTTVGYGDITPAVPAARSLSMAEALVGQLFPAVLIARLVAMELASRRDRDSR